MGWDINLRNFESKIKSKEKINLYKYLKKIKFLNWPRFIDSFKSSYKYSYNKKLILKYKKFKVINIIGMGGASMGSKAIYNFLKTKIKKKLIFTKT